MEGGKAGGERTERAGDELVVSSVMHRKVWRMRAWLPYLQR